MEKLFIGSDKSGFLLKEAIKAYLIENKYDITDVGSLSEDNALPYHEVAKIGATRLQQGEFDRGILICGTGMGMSIVANKHEGVYGAACESVFAAEKARAINDANILCMGGWIVAPIMGVAMTQTFLNTTFTQNLEDWRAANVKKFKQAVVDIEQYNFHK
jgi:ribose 5-phosphate isomerase B